MSATGHPVTLAISDGTGRSAEALRHWASGLAEIGVDAIQLREKGLADIETLERARAIAAALEGTATRLLINGRFDIAMVSSAAGVHLPAHGLPIRDVRAALGESALIGRSTHSVDEAKRALNEGADYVTFGPVYDTPSKRRYGAPLGLEALRQVAALGGRILAIGGITKDRLGEVAAAGAAGIAAIRLFQTPPSESRATMLSVREAFNRP